MATYAEPGGPYTPRAAGEMELPDIAQAVQESNAAVNPTNIGIAPQQTTTTQAQDPTVNNDLTATYRATLKGPQYGRGITNQDIVPHPDPRVVQHAGQAFSMPAFQIGAAAIGSRLQEMEAQKTELKKAAGALMAKETRQEVPAPYTRSYNKLADDAQQEFIAGLTKRFGSEAKAWERVAQDPGLRRSWERLNRDLDDTGKIIKDKVSEAELYLNGVSKDQYMYDPEAVEASQNLIKGLGELGGNGMGDVQELMRLKNEYNKHVTPQYFLKESGIDDTVKNGMAKSFRDLKVRQDGVMVLTSYEKVQQAEKLIDDIADRTYPNFADSYSRDEWRKKMHLRYPVQVELELKAVERNQPSGGSNGMNANNRIVLSKDRRPYYENQNAEGLLGKRGGVQGIDSDVVNITTQAGKQLGIYTFSDPDNKGGSVKMTPLYIQRDPVHPTELYIVGPSATNTQTVTTTDADGNVISTEQKAWNFGNETGEKDTNKSGSSRTETSKEPEFTRVSVRGNENLLTQILQGQDWRSMFTQATPKVSGKPAKTSDPLGIL